MRPRKLVLRAAAPAAGRYALSRAWLDDNIYAIRLSGELGPEANARLGKTLLDVVAEGAREIVVELVGITASEPSVVGTLVQTNNVLQARGGGLRLVCSAPELLDLLELTGLDRVLQVSTLRDEASVPPCT